ncbi:MAG: 5-oxoprolinase subunit PxpB [Thermodesulfobacteriota bacterium]
MTNSLYDTPRFRPAGDRGILAEFGEGIDLSVNRKVRAAALILEQRPPVGIVEVIPTYRSLLIIYDPMQTVPEGIEQALLALEQDMDSSCIPPPKVVDIPVCYGGDFGPDIGFVAETHGLSVDEVIRIHSEPLYPIYMIGFTPGFPFLGGLAESLHTPRLETPRFHVPEGSVGIANNQTGVYPVASPGGWRLIGRTPLRLFAPERETPFLYTAGDLIRFVPIREGDYRRIAQEQGRPEE